MKNTNAISYCALYCDNCFIRVGRIADLSKQLLNEFEMIEFSKWAKTLSCLIPEMKAFENFQNCIDVLNTWNNNMRCNNFCKKGGGSSTCKIKTCCIENKFDGCWECDKYMTCDILAWLKPVNGYQNIYNIKDIIDNGSASFIQKMKNKKYSDFYK